nr:hypothetical protein [uncultured Campylobacter sp.]
MGRYVIKTLDYCAEKGLRLQWEKGFAISVNTLENEVTIRANKSGLISLARHLLTLAQDSVPKHSHIHLDEYNSLEEGSAELILEKI